jgi:hypothetical protein
MTARNGPDREDDVVLVDVLEVLRLAFRLGVDLDARAEDRARHGAAAGARGLDDLEQGMDVLRRGGVDLLQADERGDRLVDRDAGAADVDVAVAHGDVDAGGLLDLLEIAVVSAEQLGQFFASADRNGSLH